MTDAPGTLPDKLADLLVDVGQVAGSRFTGIGLIVTASPHRLPIVPLRPSGPSLERVATARLLASISMPESEYHDGFHVLTETLRSTLVAQYFSPPIAPDVPLDRSRRFGGRYVAALFGSVLPEVVATGIASREFGMAVFVGGHETHYRAAP